MLISFPHAFCGMFLKPFKKLAARVIGSKTTGLKPLGKPDKTFLLVFQTLRKLSG